mgnify:CR=1 FL=1
MARPHSVLAFLPKSALTTPTRVARRHGDRHRCPCVSADHPRYRVNSLNAFKHARSSPEPAEGLINRSGCVGENNGADCQNFLSTLASRFHAHWLPTRQLAVASSCDASSAHHPPNIVDVRHLQKRFVRRRGIVRHPRFVFPR